MSVRDLDSQAFGHPVRALPSPADRPARPRDGGPTHLSAIAALGAGPAVTAARWARGGLNGLLAGSIMLLGGLVLWVGTPLAWLWVGSQVDGATDSLALSLLVMFVGVLASVGALAWLLARLSLLVRANAVARGHEDPGPVILENVLIVSAAIAIAIFGVWFFLLSGASPMPMGFNM